MQEWTFCPRCGGELARMAGEEGAHGHRECRRCGGPVYQHSRPCAGVLLERDGKVLLVRRDVEPFKDYWDVPGGFLNPGEHPADGAVREIREETGLRVDVGELFGIWIDTYDYADEQVYTLNCYYLATAEGEPRPSDDAAELRWFAPDQLPERIAFRHAAEVLAAWRKRVGSGQ